MEGLQVPWNYTLDDTSPVFKYSPYRDGYGDTQGWREAFTQSGFNTQPGEAGEGDSYHVTSLPGASVQLSFFGTGIRLFGVSNCSYDIFLDGSQMTVGALPYNILFSENDLIAIQHNITLVAHPDGSDQSVVFEGAQISSAASKSLTPLRVDNQNTSVISYSGDWETKYDPQIPSTENPSPYFQTSSIDSSASMNFTGRAIEIRGESNWGWWIYTVELDGNLYQYNASSWWINPDAVLFYQDGLDEDSMHSLRIINSAGSGMNVALNSVTVYKSESFTTPNTSEFPGSQSVPTSDTRAHLNSGQIAGIVIGSLFALVSIFITIMWFWRRRKENLGHLNGHPNSLLDPLSKDNPRQYLTPGAPSSCHPYDSQSSISARPRIPKEMFFGDSLFASSDASTEVGDTYPYPRTVSEPSVYVPFDPVMKGKR